MISEEGVRATPRINEAIRAGINTFDKNAEDESGSEAVMNAFIPLSYSPPAEADTGKMTFENLATADVATWLFQYLKHFEGIENAYATVNLKLDELEQQANRRQEIVDYLRENYVNPANTHQPIMFTV